MKQAVKRKKKSKAQKLRDKAWELCKKIVSERDGRKCQICHDTENQLQLDHCFSRKISRIHYDIANLGFLCATCHCHKSFENNSNKYRVYELTRKREGNKKFEEMMAIADEMGAFPEINRVWWLEELIETLEEQLEFYKIRKHESGG